MSPSTAAGSRTGLWAIPAFPLLFVARVVSWGGSAATLIALPVTMYQLTGSTQWTAAAVAAEAAPYLVVGPLAGVVGDRHSSLPLMVACDLISGTSMLSIPLAHVLGALTALHILLAALTSQVAFVFFDAGNFGLLPALVGTENILPANSVLMATGGALEACAPALTGLALAVTPAPLILTVDALTFYLSAVLLTRAHRVVRLPRQPGRASAIGRELFEAASFLVGNTVVLRSTVISGLLTVVTGAVMALLVPWADSTFSVRAGDPRLGLMYAALSAASVVGSLMAARLGPVLRDFWFFRILAPVAAVLGVSATLTPSWLLAMVALAGTVACVSASVVTAISMRQTVIPASLQSRVNVLARMLAYGLGFTSGAVTAGFLSSRLDVGMALRLTFLALVAAGMVAWLGAAVRRPPSVR